VRSADGERFAMRVHRPDYRTDAEIRSEIEWMGALAAAGLRTPAALPTRDGELLARARAAGVPQPRQCDLFRWVSGEPVGTLEGGVAAGREAARHSYELLGELAARVHEHGAQWKRPEGFSRPVWDADALVGEDPVFGRFWELGGLDAERLRVLFAARDRARERLEALPRTPDRWGLLHGDFLPENILMDARGPQLIDFDDCGEGWYGFELATGLFPLLRQEIFDDVLDAYLRGYRRVRALDEEGLDALPSFLMARGLSYLGWPVGRPEMEEARSLAPLLAELITAQAQRYLDGAPLAP
jgi:Ser/Thr protein kinase RdoA (MazF antagonist)